MPDFACEDHFKNDSDLRTFLESYESKKENLALPNLLFSSLIHKTFDLILFNGSTICYFGCGTYHSYQFS